MNFSKRNFLGKDDLMNKLKINPGYDGVYGEIVLDDKEKFLKKNKSLGDF